LCKCCTPRVMVRLAGNCNQGAVLGHAVHDLVQGHDNFWRPDAILFEWHELDKAQHHAFFPGKHAERNDLIFIEAAQEHAVNFYGSQANTLRGSNSRKHVIEPVRYTRDTSETVRVDRV